VPFPFDDLSATKLRPAVCLTGTIGQNRHIVVAFITSREVSDLLPTDIAMPANHPDFRATGLRADSITPAPFDHAFNFNY
jgi:mRNA interferase MazF